jgi:pyruvate dehydrogenase E2 component (dihydrolipoamide acetyltransferase)
MSFFIRMPKLSPTMETGIIAKWHLREQQVVKPGEALLEVATDKATIEHPCLDGGFLRKIFVLEGQEAKVNQAIALVTATLEEDLSAFINEYEKESAALNVSMPSPSILDNVILDVHPNEAIDHSRQKNLSPNMTSFSYPSFKAAGPIPEEKSCDYRARGTLNDPSSKLKVSPYARKLSLDRKIDLESIRGTGPNGRIIAQDLEGAAVMTQWQQLFKCEEALQEAKAGSYELEAMSPMRKAVATRLFEAKTSIPHFYVTSELDASPLAQLQLQLKTQGLKLSINDLIIRAVALALKKHPQLNSGFDSSEQKIIRFKTIDIAVAVALDEGLITPILFQADCMKVQQISTKVKQLVKACQNGTLKPYEYRGGSFTISNLGMFGVNSFQAILNPPQSAILAVGGMIEKPVVRKGALEVGLTMTLTLSCDHRVIDGADAAKFLVTLKQLIEAPAILLI